MSKMDEIMAMDPGPSPDRGAAPDRRGTGSDSATDSRRRTGSGRPRQGDWLNGQLRRLYDDVLNEPIPDDLLDLIGRLDEAGKADGNGDDAPGARGGPAGDPNQTRENSRS